MKKNPTPKTKKKLLLLYSRVYFGQYLAQDFIIIQGVRVKGSGLRVLARVSVYTRRYL